jgi:peptidoglycan hydrolase-like amidase
MRFNRKLLLTICAVFIAFTVIISPFAHIVSARTEAEIQADIDAQNAKLAETQGQLDAAQAKLNGLQNDLNNTQGQIPKLQAEIAQIEATIEFNSLQMQILSEQQKLKEVELEQRQKRQDKALVNAYLDWRKDNKFSSYLLTEERTHPMKKEVYQSLVMDDEQVSIDDLVGQISKIKGDLNKFGMDTETLQAQNEALKVKKAEIEAQVLALQYSVNSQSSAVAGLRGSADTIKASVAQLSAEQRAVIEYEAWLLSQGGSGGGNVDPGEIFFWGRGRDMVQGHGVGMSQYGAYGAALAGLSANQILGIYYTGVSIANYPMNSHISVRYCEDDPVFDPYQDDWQGKCNDGRYPVVSRITFDQYLAGIGEMPGSWPVEARKAQIIAARTYAIKNTNNGDPNYPICLTTYCQVSYVMNGFQGEASLVQATKDIVITYNGAPIDAMYSADNNQGRGTADYDTSFQNIDGSTYSPHPYLVAVDDNATGLFTPEKMYWNTYCGSSACGDWNWTTNGYTYGDIDTMLDYVNYDGHYGSWVTMHINDMRQRIGNVVAIEFIRDGSNRVKRVKFTGTKGQSGEIGGWWFKNIWNTWVYSRGTTDYIYSQTFNLSLKP